MLNTLIKWVGIYFPTVGFQNVILLLTVAITYYIYHKNKNDEIKEMAAIIVLQIQSIEKNIAEFQECFQNDYEINKEIAYRTSEIFRENSWEVYRYCFVNILGRNNYIIIDEFYKIIIDIKNQQEKIKEFYNKIFEMEGERKKSEIKVPEIFIITSKFYLNKYQKISTSAAFEKLLKLAKIN